MKKAILYLMPVCVIVLSVIFYVCPARAASIGDTWFSQYAQDAYDLTGDGEAEQIEFIPNDQENDWFTTLTVLVGGQKALKIYDVFSAYSYAFFSKGKMTYLFLEQSGEDDVGSRILYSYRNGLFKREAVINDNIEDIGYSFSVQVDEIKATKKGFKIVESSQFCGLPFCQISVPYEVQNGRLTIASNTYDVFPSFYSISVGEDETDGENSPYLTTQKPISLYKDKNCKKETKLLPAGNLVSVTKIYRGNGFSSYYIDGEGWYRVENGSYEAQELFVGVYYAG